MLESETIGPQCFWQGQLIRLRPFRTTDIEVMSIEEQDSEAIRVLEAGIQPMRSADMLKVRLEHALQEPPADILSFAVEARTGDLVGAANLRDWQNREGPLLLLSAFIPHTSGRVMLRRR